MKKRIAVGRIFHESNGFNPRPTIKSDFEIVEGDELLSVARKGSATLCGIVQKLDTEAIDILPIISVNSPPSGLVDHAFYIEIRNTWLRRIENEDIDGIAIELHGAMATTECGDADGDFLAQLRKAVGPAVVIGVGLDLHAHITPLMLENADICIACKENPHSDTYECGERVVELMLDVIAGKLFPETVMAKARTILPGRMSTAEVPLSDFHRRAREITASVPAIRDISIYNVFRYLDVEDIGEAVVILTDRDAEVAEPFVMELTQMFWDRREEFTDDLLTIDEALDMSVNRNKISRNPLVFADMGDRVLAGAPGDSTHFLKAALNRMTIKGALPITDENAVTIARQAGVGAEIDIDLGGQYTPAFSSIRVKCLVKYLSDGQFVMRGPYQKGEPSSMGSTAVLEIDNRIQVVVTSKAAYSHDPNVFESQGVIVSDQDFVVVKSGYHFKLNFAGLGETLLVASPGVSYYTPGGMPRNRGLFWPEHDVSDNPVIKPQRFLPANRG